MSLPEDGSTGDVITQWSLGTLLVVMLLLLHVKD